MNRYVNSLLIASCLCTSIASTTAWAGGAECVDGSTIRVCVEWSLLTNPEENTDFNVFFTDESNPDVVLRTGDLGWKVSSEVIIGSAPANIGTISINANGSTDNFGVSIIKGSGAGAANVGTINLNDPNDTTLWTGYSTLSGGSISGNLTNGLTVIKNGSGGGMATFTVGGNAAGTA